MSGRPVRSLEHLENSASTTRVLNLRSVASRFRKTPEWRERPLFFNDVLNRSIIVKHRLRQNEIEDFSSVRRSATKILFPIDTANLHLGARYVFIGQRDFNEIMSEIFGIRNAEDDRDMKTLRLIDAVPSLDPFLLREQLKRHGIDAAPCYFDISEADTQRMLNFAQYEIQKLVEMSFGEDERNSGHAATLARKILTDASSSVLEPLRKTMQLSPHQYQEGIFCWKAFIYYKWRLASILPEVNGVIERIMSLTPRGVMDRELKTEIATARERIRLAIKSALRRVRETLGVYDQAYQSLTVSHEPAKFRDFLLNAPSLFDELGERLGSIDHVVSFWRFRFPNGQKPNIEPEELADIFADFEQSLAFENIKRPKPTPPPGSMISSRASSGADGPDGADAATDASSPVRDRAAGS